MKTITGSFRLWAVLLICVGGTPASAQTIYVYMTGGGGARPEIVQSIESAMGGNFAAADNSSTPGEAGLESAKMSVFGGNINGSSTVVECTFTTAGEGVESVAPLIPAPVLFLDPSVLPAPAPSGNIVYNQSLLTTNYGNVAFSEACPSSWQAAFPAGIQNMPDLQLSQLQSSSIGVVPYEFVCTGNCVGSNGIAVSNISAMQARALWNNTTGTPGAVALQVFTGNPADSNTLVYSTGRDLNSGDRMAVCAAAGIASSPVNQNMIAGISASNQAPNFGEVWDVVPVAGGDLFPVDILFPRETIPPWGYDDLITGMGGISRGGTLANQMKGPLTNNYIFMTYFSIPDATQATTGTPGSGGQLAMAMNYNGVAYSASAVEQGQYTLWSYECMIVCPYHVGNPLSYAQSNVIAAIRSNILNLPSAATDGWISLHDMVVTNGPCPCGSGSQTGTFWDNFGYTLNGSNITITSYVGSGGAINIPGTINGYPVTAISAGAFSGCSNLTSVTIGTNVTSIGSNAFNGCINLTSVAIPDSVATIGSDAFYGCSSLNSAYFEGNEPAMFGSGVFSGAAPGFAIYYPPGATGFGTPTWNGYPTGPEAPSTDFIYTDNGTGTVVTITGYTGGGGRVIIPGAINNEPVTAIGDAVFAYCSNLTSVAIPSSVTIIGNAAFYACSNLTGITIPPRVTSIGAVAFNSCGGLTSVTLSSNVTSIGDAAFAACTQLSQINVDSANSNYVSSGGVLLDILQTKLMQVPAGSTRSAYAIPGSVTTIGVGAFANCAGLTSVTIPSNVTIIGPMAFSGCTSLSSISIPTKVVVIGSQAFAGCTGLTSVAIPYGVFSIGSAPFAFCRQLSQISVDPANTNFASSGGALFDSTFSTLIQVPAAQTGTYSIPTSVTSIGSGALAGCNLTSVTVPAGVTSIGTSAFAGCARLTWINVDPANLNYASSGGVLFDKTISTLIQVPKGLTGSYSVPASVTSIGSGAVAGCAGLTSVTIGANVASIGDWAFDGCPNLSGLYFNGNAPASLGSDVFDGYIGAVEYLPGTGGWGTTLGGLPTGLWTLPYPLILNSTLASGSRSNQFGFTISWATNRSVVVYASTNLGLASWQPLQTNTQSGGISYFSDPAWTIYPERFYEIISPVSP